MAEDTRALDTWPTTIKEDEELYVLVDDNYDVQYLMFACPSKGGLLMRDNGTWNPVDTYQFHEDHSGEFSIDEVDTNYVRYYDSFDMKGEKPRYEVDADGNYNYALTAAAQATPPTTCPPATQDIGLNLKNRQNAIETAGYGPLNPAEPNEEFWQEKADRWSVTIEGAKKSLCGNCAVFIITKQMRDCIAGGLEQGGSSEDNAWDAIDAAELGYCEAFDFKCAASRTCDAWVAGGPVQDKVQVDEGAN
jgi:hypothetical protein